MVNLYAKVQHIAIQPLSDKLKNYENCLQVGEKYFMILPFLIMSPPVFLHKPIMYGKVPWVYGKVSLDSVNMFVWVLEAGDQCDVKIKVQHQVPESSGPPLTIYQEKFHLPN